MAFLFSGGKTNSQQPAAARGITIQSSVYGAPLQKGFGTNKAAGNLIGYYDFTAVGVSSGGGGKGGVAGGGKGGSSSGYNYYVTALTALGCGPIQGIGRVWSSKHLYPTFAAWAGANGFLFTGTYPQTPWSYLTSKHPGQDLSYPGIAYTAFSNGGLGSSPELPNMNWEVQWGSFVGGGPDADPSLVINDILTNVHDGIGFPTGFVGDMTTLQNYTLAAGLLISPLFSQQKAVATTITDLCTALNVAPVWASGKLSFIPYGDTALTGNGKTYTPPSIPQYDLTDDDFLTNQSASGASGSSTSDPILISRPDQSTVPNSIVLEYSDRASAYNPATVQYKNPALIQQFGEAPEPSARDGHIFCDGSAAQISVNLQGNRALGRNTYQWATDDRFIGLDPMDIVTLTNSRMGLVKVWVRITEITENDDGSLAFVAEEYLQGTGHSPAFSFSSGSGYNADYNSAPGNINTPVIFEAPVQIAPTGLEVWCAASGGSNYGGCDIWVSTDNQNYKLAGRIEGRCRQGTLTANLASGTDPDTTHTLSVDLTESAGALSSGTQANADNAQTLCYVDGELISYQDATLTATFNYNLTTYLRRGLFGTTIGAHLSGSQFARLDNSVFHYSYDKSQIGQTLYLKFLAFNIWGGGQQQLTDVAAYTHVLTGPPKPPNVTNFQAQQNGNVVVFAWSQVADFALKGYDIGFAPVGTVLWSNFEILTEAAKGTEMTNAAVPPGTWLFGIRARDIADQLSVAWPTVSLTVVNNEDVIAQNEQDPQWLGAQVNFVQHWTGVLVPIGTKTSDQYTQIAAPAAPTTGTTVSGALAPQTLYVKTTLVSPSGETTASAETVQVVPALSVLTVTAPASAGNATGWNVYVSTTTGTETLQNATPMSFSQHTWQEPNSGLIAGAALPASNTTGWDVFDVFVPDVTPGPCTYTTSTIDTGFIDTLRVWSASSLVEGPTETGTPLASTSLDAWTAGPDPGLYVPWTIGDVNMRYMNMLVSYSPVQGAVAFLQTFDVTIDRNPIVENAASAVIAPGGSTITFPTQFHILPFIAGSVISAGTGLYVTFANVTLTTFDAHVWNSAGADVGGTINWTATGS